MISALWQRQTPRPSTAPTCLPLTTVIAIVFVGLLAEGRAQEPWYYRLGTEKVAQQVNFCMAEKTVLGLARVFEQQGPRAGYEALDHAPDCRIGVQTFTPLAVVRRVPIKTGDGSQYVVSFVKVRTSRGATEYLVTTRDVRE